MRRGRPARRVRGHADSVFARVIGVFARLLQRLQGAAARAIEELASSVRLPWSWPRLGTIVLLAVFASPAAVGIASRSAGTAFQLEAETMTSPGVVVASDASASGGKALQLTGATVAAASVTTTTTTSTLMLRARGVECRGAPRAVISADGKKLLSVAVSSTDWTTYTATLRRALASGGHKITAKLGNPASKGSCRRMLYLDLISGETADDEPLPAGIFIAPSGSDTTGDGSISKPFATLAKAQATMRLGGPQITYIRGGFYALPAVTQNGVSYGLYLTAADSGQTWSYYPPDGYNSAILDGGSTSSSTGTKELITIEGASHITINGLQLQHFRWLGVGLHGGSRFKELFPASTGTADANTVTNNIVQDGSYDTSPVGGYGGGAFYGERDIPNTTVTNNVIYNISTSGIQAENGGSGSNLSSLRVANNVVLSTCLLVRDCGSIYVQDSNTTSTNIRIINNFVRDSGTPASKARSIYLDDGVSGAVVSNNISTGIFNFAFTIHGGSNNSISSNIIDMGPSNNREILLYQGNGLTAMTGNTVQSNLVVSGGAGGWYEGKSFGAQPTITNNVYHQYAGAPVYTGGLGGLNGDASPVSADPQLSCWPYLLASGSPVYSRPVSFIPLPRYWGPPGYTLPQTGTPPSQPHSC